MNNKIINEKNLNSYLDILSAIKNRQVPYLPKYSFCENKVVYYTVPKEFSYIFSTILKLIPLYYESSEDNDVIHYTIIIPTHSYFDEIVYFLDSFSNHLWNLK